MCIAVTGGAAGTSSSSTAAAGAGSGRFRFSSPHRGSAGAGHSAMANQYRLTDSSAQSSLENDSDGGMIKNPTGPGSVDAQAAPISIPIPPSFIQSTQQQQQQQHSHHHSSGRSSAHQSEHSSTTPGPRLEIKSMFKTHTNVQKVKPRSSVVSCNFNSFYRLKMLIYFNIYRKISYNL